jgi:TPR repeat protein
MPRAIKFLCCLLASVSLSAHADLIKDCSLAAAHPDDPSKFGSGISFKLLDGSSARNICLAAYRSNPTDGLVNSTLARAYSKLEKYDLSLRHARLAVKAEYPFGYYMVGLHHTYGDGVEKNEAVAMEWYKKAAERGVPKASHVIGNSYLKGDGVEENIDLAEKWLSHALESGYTSAYKQLVDVYKKKADALLQHKLLGKITPDKLSPLARADYDSYLTKASSLKNYYKKPSLAERLPLPDTEGSGYTWQYLNGSVTEQDTVYRRSHTKVADNIFTLWAATPKNGGKTEWYIDFDYRGDSRISSIDKIIAQYEDNDREDSEALNLSGTEISKTQHSYRAITKTDYRAVELLRAGTKVKVGFWAKKNDHEEYTSFTFALNDQSIKATSKPAIDQLVGKISQINPSCCENAKITPFSEMYSALKKASEAQPDNKRVDSIKPPTQQQIAAANLYIQMQANKKAENERKKAALELEKAKIAQQKVLAEQQQKEKRAQYQRTLSNFDFPRGYCDRPSMPSINASDWEVEKTNQQAEEYWDCMNGGWGRDLRALRQLITNLGGSWRSLPDNKWNWSLPDDCKCNDYIRKLMDNTRERAKHRKNALDSLNAVINSRNNRLTSYESKQRRWNELDNALDKFDRDMEQMRRRQQQQQNTWNNQYITPSYY